MDQLKATVCPVCLSDAHDRQVYAANFSLQHLTPEVFSARRLPDRLHFRMVVCKQCGLLRANPVLASETLAMLYAQSHAHDEVLAQAASATYLEYFRRYSLEPPFQGRLLEIGCGSGVFLRLLIQQGMGQVYGVEPGKEAVSAAQDLKGLIYNGMFGAGIYPPDYFDTICAFQMFDHLDNPGQFLKDCYYYLKPGGKLFLIMHDIHAITARILGQACPMVDIEHPFLYNTRTLSALLAKNGFAVQEKFSVYNRYPLKYWAHLMPMAPAVKKPVLGFLQDSLVGKIPLTLGLGNMGMVACK
jgi:2-polyprenyl-3-methyl-5-hydroxy-6-metoxy-1,4-benzoquinol methylase